MMVAWELTLLDILAVVPKANCKAICRLEKTEGKNAQWDLRWIQSIWADTCEEAIDTGSLVFQFEGDPQLCDTHLRPVQGCGTRELLFGLPPASTSQMEASTPTQIK